MKTSFQVSTDISLAKTVGHFEFSNFFVKIAKHKNPCILKTVPDRANLAKFLTHRVSVKASLSKFQQIFHSLKTFLHD